MKEKDGAIIAPGIGDDSRGLAALPWWTGPALAVTKPALAVTGRADDAGEQVGPANLAPAMPPNRT